MSAALGAVRFHVPLPDRAQLWGSGNVTLWLGRFRHRRMVALMLLPRLRKRLLRGQWPQARAILTVWRQA